MQAVLGLSGAVEIATAGVSKYVEAFNSFAFLWQRDLASEYAKFVATHPTREVGVYSSFAVDLLSVLLLSSNRLLLVHMQAFEAEMKKYMAVEQAVAAVPSSQVLGPLSLETLPLKSSLKSEAASWKAQFARNLHKHCADDLKVFETYVKDTKQKLARQVEDLEDVRYVMAVLKEVRLG